MVGTFQWLDLVEKALDDRERVEPDSLALLKVSLHTEVRKRAYYDQWVRRYPTAPLTEFHQKFAKAAVGRIADHFELSEEDVAQLQHEFGLPPVVAKGDAAAASFLGRAVGG